MDLSRRDFLKIGVLGSSFLAMPCICGEFLQKVPFILQSKNVGKPESFIFVYGSYFQLLITAISFEPLDERILLANYPFETNPEIIEHGNANSLGKLQKKLAAADVLVVTTCYPERDLYFGQNLADSAENAFLKLFFTPRKVPIDHFTSQIFYQQRRENFSAQMAHFLALVVGSGSREGYIGLKVNDLLEVCKMTNLHFRSYPWSGGNSLREFLTTCFSEMEGEKIACDKVCFAMLFGDETATLDRVLKTKDIILNSLGGPDIFLFNWLPRRDGYHSLSMLIG